MRKTKRTWLRERRRDCAALGHLDARNRTILSSSPCFLQKQQKESSPEPCTRGEIRTRKEKRPLTPKKEWDWNREGDCAEWQRAEGGGAKERGRAAALATYHSMPRRAEARRSGVCVRVCARVCSGPRRRAQWRSQARDAQREGADFPPPPKNPLSVDFAQPGAAATTPRRTARPPTRQRKKIKKGANGDSYIEWHIPQRPAPQRSGGESALGRKVRWGGEGVAIGGIGAARGASAQQRSGRRTTRKVRNVRNAAEHAIYRRATRRNDEAGGAHTRERGTTRQPPSPWTSKERSAKKTMVSRIQCRRCLFSVHLFFFFFFPPSQKDRSFDGEGRKESLENEQA